MNREERIKVKAEIIPTIKDLSITNYITILEDLLETAKDLEKQGYKSYKDYVDSLPTKTR